MFGVEIDMVVTDSLKALDLYKEVFDVEPIEVTSFEKGLNEVIFTMYNTRFHLLDENLEYSLTAPKPDAPISMWINIVVPDIKSTYDKAIAAGCVFVQPITEVLEYGVINAIFSDPFGYLWMLHEIVQEVSFEDRCKLAEEQIKNDKK